MNATTKAKRTIGRISDRSLWTIGHFLWLGTRYEAAVCEQRNADGELRRRTVFSTRMPERE